MCASIHLGFKMEALKSASPTQGSLGPVRSHRQNSIQDKYQSNVSLSGDANRHSTEEKIFSAMFFTKAS